MAIVWVPVLMLRIDGACLGSESMTTRTNPTGAGTMWRTSRGTRTLKGAEWELFREGLGLLWDDAEERIEDASGSLYPTGIPIYERLQPSERLAMLALVGQALHDPDVPAPRLTALTECVVGAVFQVIASTVLFEIDMEGQWLIEDVVEFRPVVLKAARECKIRCRPKVTSRDEDAWTTLITDDLANRILFDDDDYRFEHFADMPPELADEVKALLRIDPDYFVDVPPDPTPAELEGYRATMRRLCPREAAEA
jgi:hypothetical protein